MIQGFKVKCYQSSVFIKFHIGRKKINELSYAFSISYVRLDLYFFVYFFFYLCRLCFFNDTTKEAEIHYKVKALPSTSEGKMWHWLHAV